MKRHRTAYLALTIFFAASALALHDEPVVTQPVAKGTSSAVCSSGVANGYACSRVDLVARLPLADIGGGGGTDSWGWSDPETGKDYALLARTNGTSFVDISDPANPVYLGNLPSTAGQSSWRDLKTYNNHVFIVADAISNHGLQVFDLTRLRDVESPQTFTADTIFGGFGPAHNVAINEDTGFAYVVGDPASCQGGLLMIDISLPTTPRTVGCFADDGYTHDVQCVVYQGPDVEHQGREVCFASNEDTLTIVDVTDKGSPRQLSRTNYPDVGYSHQGWLTDDHAHFLLGDELDELRSNMNTRTLFFNLSDLDAPAYSGAHIAGTPTVDHNLYVRDGYVYQANYAAGLRILKIDDAAAAEMTEVAFFDTHPEEDSRNFDGAWNVYPFFDNGIILVSDRSDGLFVLQSSLGPAPGRLRGVTSGAYINAEMNDQGMLAFVGENQAGPFVFWAWFTYLDGEPFWLIGNANYETGADEVLTTAFRFDGLNFLETDALANSNEAGTVLFHVHDCGAVHLTYDLGDLGSGEAHMNRFASAAGQTCID